MSAAGPRGPVTGLLVHRSRLTGSYNDWFTSSEQALLVAQRRQRMRVSKPTSPSDMPQQHSCKPRKRRQADEAQRLGAAAPAAYDYRRGANEPLDEAPVTLVRGVAGTAAALPAGASGCEHRFTGYQCPRHSGERRRRRHPWPSNRKLARASPCNGHRRSRRRDGGSDVGRDAAARSTARMGSVAQTCPRSHRWTTGTSRKASAGRSIMCRPRALRTEPSWSAGRASLASDD
jgi:hypothetical protein